MDLFSQDLNPVTGDIGFNPASFGLSLKDIDKAASIKLKAALTSWGLALTQDQYREVMSISETKYQWLDAQSWNFDGSVLPSSEIYPMTWKDPWLYLTQEHMGFWTGSTWASYIGNNGDFEFQGNANNYIRWNGTALEIQWVLQMTDGTPIEDYIEANGTKPMVNSQYDSWLDKYKQWLSAWDLLPYTISWTATGVYMTSQWLFWVKNGVDQFSISSSTGDAMFRGTVYASGGEFNGDITASGTITGWVFQWWEYRVINPNTNEYVKMELWKMTLNDSNNRRIISIDSWAFSYINSSSLLWNTSPSLKIFSKYINATYWSPIVINPWYWNHSDNTFSPSGNELMFVENTPTAVASVNAYAMTTTTPWLSAPAQPIMVFRGYASIDYLINASFVGRMKIPVWNNLY